MTKTECKNWLLKLAIYFWRFRCFNVFYCRWYWAGSQSPPSVDEAANTLMTVWVSSLGRKSRKLSQVTNTAWKHRMKIKVNCFPVNLLKCGMRSAYYNQERKKMFAGHGCGSCQNNDPKCQMPFQAWNITQSECFFHNHCISSSLWTPFSFVLMFKRSHFRFRFLYWMNEK